MTRRALITGIGGQDGSLLAEILLAQGYEVCGVTRAGREYGNLRETRERLLLEHTDLLDADAVRDLVARVAPSEIYNLAAPSFGPASWDEPAAVLQSGATGVALLLEAVARTDPDIRFCQASSSEIFGHPDEAPQSETTPVRPVTPYGAAKACGHFLVQAYRERYGLFACSAILYNHESERRSLRFLPRKVARGAAAIALGLDEELVLGDLGARRDWGLAFDYARGLWLMLLHDTPGDYVLATGRTHSVEELVACAFERAGLDYSRHVRVDPALTRPGESAVELVGDSSRARSVLDWEPSVTFVELVHRLVDHELGVLSEPGSPRRRATGRAPVTGTAPLRLVGGGALQIEGDELDLSVLAQLRTTDGVWEPHVRAVFERLVRPDWVCIDVGAHIGAHTLTLATLARHVVAFEANSQSCAHLRANLRASAVEDRVTVVEAALWDGTEALELVATHRFPGSSYVTAATDCDSPKPHPQIAASGLAYAVETRPVRTLRLDDWLRESGLDRLDLVKIDVEGAEQVALAGAEETLRTFRPVLVTEYNPDCARTLFGAAPDAYFEWLAERFDVIEAIGSDGALGPVESWSTLAKVLAEGPGWTELLCSSAT